MNSNSYDVIIVGGGIMGCAAAYYLTRTEDNLNVTVVERDFTYSQASTTLSMANARIQFSLKDNIQISQKMQKNLQTINNSTNYVECIGVALDI